MKNTPPIGFVSLLGTCTHTIGGRGSLSLATCRGDLFQDQGWKGGGV